MSKEDNPNSQKQDLPKTPQQQRDEEIEARLAASQARLNELQAKIAARHKADANRAAAFAAKADREAYYESLRVKVKPPELQSPTHASSNKSPKKPNGNRRGFNILPPDELEVRLQKALAEKAEKKRVLREGNPRFPQKEGKIEEQVENAIRRVKARFEVLSDSDEQ